MEYNLPRLGYGASSSTRFFARRGWGIRADAIRERWRCHQAPLCSIAIQTSDRLPMRGILEIEDRSVAQPLGLDDPRINDVAFIDDGEVVAVDELRAGPLRIVVAPESIDRGIGFARPDVVRAIATAGGVTTLGSRETPASSSYVTPSARSEP